MGENNLTNFFSEYVKQESLFIRKQALQNNFFPDAITHRDEQIMMIAKILAPVLKGNKPSNLFVYGKTGTGKTLTIRHITDNLLKTSESQKIPLKVIYLNCKMGKVADTEYRLIATLAREFGQEVPITGLPTDEIYSMFFRCVERAEKSVFIILDEIDSIIGKIGDGILYNLTRINSELKKSQITIIGISNDLVFTDNLDPRVKSSLSEEEVVYPPYNAFQLQNILRERAVIAFKENAVEAGVIEKCAALSAREHGDARRAIELLRVAGELAERDQLKSIGLKHIDSADDKIEKDRVLDTILKQPKQYHVVVYSILKLTKNSEAVMTGEVYDLYKNVCNTVNLRPLTQRRVSDVISELDVLGIINAKVTSKGRYGRTREITTEVGAEIIDSAWKAVSEELGL